MKEGGRDEATHSAGHTHTHTHTNLTGIGCCHNQDLLSVPPLCVTLLLLGWSGRFRSHKGQHTQHWIPLSSYLSLDFATRHPSYYLSNFFCVALSPCSRRFLHPPVWSDLRSTLWSEALTHVQLSPTNTRRYVFLSVFISHTAGALWPLLADLHFKILHLHKRSRVSRRRWHSEDLKHVQEKKQVKIK